LRNDDPLPEDTFDCILVPQALHLIFDLTQVVERLHSALIKGGTILLTVPGVSQIDRGEWGDQCCWGFTSTSLRQLFEPSFGRECLRIKAFGNVCAAIAHLQGAVAEDVGKSRLDMNDPAYPVIVSLRGEKC